MSGSQRDSTTRSTTGGGYVTYNDCHGAMDQAVANIVNSVNAMINSQFSGLTEVRPRVVTPDDNAWTCVPVIGQPGSSVTGWATIDYNALAFRASDAQQYAFNQVKNQLTDSHYVWKSGQPSACSGPNTSVSGTTISVTCPSSGIAVYNWNSSTQSVLKQALGGKSLQDAQSLCNANFPGVKAGTCKIKLSGGNTPTLPGSSKISIHAG